MATTHAHSIGLDETDGPNFSAPPDDLLKTNMVLVAGVEPHSLRYRYVFQDFSMMYCAVMERVGVALCPPDRRRRVVDLRRTVSSTC